MDGTSWLLGTITGFLLARLSMGNGRRRRKENSPVIPLYTKGDHLLSEASRTLSQNSFPRSGVGHSDAKGPQAILFWSEKDTEKGTVTLGFSEQTCTARNARDLKVIIGLIESLHQELNEHLQFYCKDSSCGG